MNDFLNPSGQLIVEGAKHVLIDGDIICYSCASAADGRGYKVLDGSLEGTFFENAKDANKYLEHLGLSKELWRTPTFKPEPVENCLHSVKLMVKSILEGVNNLLSPSGQVGNYTIFITGKDNFRYTIDPEYKANRVNIRRPAHLKACQDYLIKHYETIVCHGVEADDAMGIAQCTEPYGTTVIATLDKDLDMIPGWHYRWATATADARLYETDEEAARRCYFRQMITGDATDNIEGLSEKAPKKRSYSTEPLEGMGIYDMTQYVREGYAKKYPDKKRAYEEMRKAHNLLFILRECKEIKQLNDHEFLYTV